MDLYENEGFSAPAEYAGPTIYDDETADGDPCAETTHQDEWAALDEDDPGWRQEVDSGLPIRHADGAYTVDAFTRADAELATKRLWEVDQLQAEVEAFIDSEIEDLMTRLEALKQRKAAMMAPIERKRAYLQSRYLYRLEEWARTLIGDRNARSEKLAYGTVSIVKGTTVLVPQDEDAAIQYALENGYSWAVKQSLKVADVKKHILTTGEAWDGAKPTKKESTFALKLEALK